MVFEAWTCNSGARDDERDCEGGLTEGFANIVSNLSFRWLAGDDVMETIRRVVILSPGHLVGGIGVLWGSVLIKEELEETREDRKSRCASSSVLGALREGRDASHDGAVTRGRGERFGRNTSPGRLVREVRSIESSVPCNELEVRGRFIGHMAVGICRSRHCVESRCGRDVWLECEVVSLECFQKN
jgi:hypothetical protein